MVALPSLVRQTAAGRPPRRLCVAALRSVARINTDNPDFLSDAFALPDAGFGDLAAVDERGDGGDDVVADGDAAAYLVAVAADFRVLVVRLAEDGDPEAYAVVAAAPPAYIASGFAP